MQAGTVVMTEVVTLVHEVHFVIDGDGVGEIILGALRVVKSVLDPGGHGHDEIHDEKGNQDVGNADSPVINKNGCEVNCVEGDSPQHAATVLVLASGFKVHIGDQAHDRPNVAREIPEEIHFAGAVVADGGGGVVGSAIFFVVEADVHGAIEFWNVAIQEAKEEFDVAAEDLVVFVREVTLAAVRFQVFGAEHSDEALKLETVEGKIEGQREPEQRFPYNELRQENWHGGKGDGDHEAQRGNVSGVAQNNLAEAIEEPVVSGGEKLICGAQGTDFSQPRGGAVEAKGRQGDERQSGNAGQSDGNREQAKRDSGIQALRRVTRSCARDLRRFVQVRFG